MDKGGCGGGGGCGCGASVRNGWLQSPHPVCVCVSASSVVHRHGRCQEEGENGYAGPTSSSVRANS